MTPVISWPSSPQANSNGVGIIAIIDRKAKRPRRRSRGIMISGKIAERRIVKGDRQLFRKAKKQPVPKLGFFQSSEHSLRSERPFAQAHADGVEDRLAMDAAGGIVAPSPAPSGATSGRLMSTMSRSGTSGNLKIG
jgi:hypothetical protein